MLKSFWWIADCIKSCKNEFQLSCCQQLVKLFDDKYNETEGFERCVSSLNSILDAISILMSESTDVIN